MNASVGLTTCQPPTRDGKTDGRGAPSGCTCPPRQVKRLTRAGRGPVSHHRQANRASTAAGRTTHDPKTPGAACSDFRKSNAGGPKGEGRPVRSPRRVQPVETSRETCPAGRLRRPRPGRTSVGRVFRLNYLPTVDRGGKSASRPRVRVRRGKWKREGVPPGVCVGHPRSDDGPKTGRAARPGCLRTSATRTQRRKREGRPVRGACRLRQVGRTADSRSVPPAASRTGLQVGEAAPPRVCVDHGELNAPVGLTTCQPPTRGREDGREGLRQVGPRALVSVRVDHRKLRQSGEGVRPESASSAAEVERLGSVQLLANRGREAQLDVGPSFGLIVSALFCPRCIVAATDYRLAVDCRASVPRSAVPDSSSTGRRLRLVQLTRPGRPTGEPQPNTPQQSDVSFYTEAKAVGEAIGKEGASGPGERSVGGGSVVSTTCQPTAPPGGRKDGLRKAPRPVRVRTLLKPAGQTGRGPRAR